MKSLEAQKYFISPQGHTSVNRANYHMHDYLCLGGPSVSNPLICASLSSPKLVYEVLTLFKANLYVWELSWASDDIYKSNECRSSFHILTGSP